MKYGRYMYMYIKEDCHLDEWEIRNKTYEALSSQVSMMSCPLAMKHSALAILLRHTKNVLIHVQLLTMIIDTLTWYILVKLEAGAVEIAWLDKLTHLFLLFFAAPLGGVTGLPAFNPPYGNFFLSAGFRIWKDVQTDWHLFLSITCRLGKSQSLECLTLDSVPQCGGDRKSSCKSEGVSSKLVWEGPNTKACPRNGRGGVHADTFIVCTHEIEHEF